MEAGSLKLPMIISKGEHAIIGVKTLVNTPSVMRHRNSPADAIILIQQVKDESLILLCCSLRSAVQPRFIPEPLTDPVLRKDLDKKMLLILFPMKVLLPLFLENSTVQDFDSWM